MSKPAKKPKKPKQTERQKLVYRFWDLLPPDLDEYSKAIDTLMIHVDTRTLEELVKKMAGDVDE